MTQTPPFVRWMTPSGRREADALFGFSLPFLPDMLSSPRLSTVAPQHRVDEALRLQLQMVKRLWSYGVAAWDLRFIGTDDLPGVAIGVLCRMSRPQQVTPTDFHRYCQQHASHIQRLFADFDYELVPLTDEASLNRYLMPFRIQAIGEMRRFEEVVVAEDAYTEYEFYVPYPWHWSNHNRLRLFEALLKRQGNCLVSVCLEPTQLGSQEQRHVHHASSPQIKALLHRLGSTGQTIINIYHDYAQNLQQPYVVHITIATTTPQTMQHVAWQLRDEIHSAQTVQPGERAMLNHLHTTSGNAPILATPYNQQEWQLACQTLGELTWLPWGKNEGMALPGTARLRYLMNDVEASMVFRLPVVRVGDLAGTPVRPLTPTMHSSPTLTADVPTTTSIQPTAQPSQPSQRDTTLKKTPPVVSRATIHKPEDLVGMTLGTCQIEALLGQGGFGAVYRAKQTLLNRQVAVKIILDTFSQPTAGQQQKLIARFDREAQAIARLDHPNIITVYEYQAHPIPYLVMPYIAGGSLADERTASGRRPVPVHGVATILQQVASALDHAHQQKLIHRDMKPHNLLRHADGRVLLSDFGIVQFEDDEYTALTSFGEYSPHTPGYASPEQLQKLTLDARSDIYSLGIVIYELLCGQRPYSNPLHQLQTPPPAMSSHSVSIQPEIEAVVKKALAIAPTQRYSSAGEMASAFLQALR
ncbi:MAG: hypothetical protein NVSMB38_39820 [Ktedonobacteraceae bacterium]